MLLIRHTSEHLRWTEAQREFSRISYFPMNDRGARRMSTHCFRVWLVLLLRCCLFYSLSPARRDRRKIRRRERRTKRDHSHCAPPLITRVRQRYEFSYSILGLFFVPYLYCTIRESYSIICSTLPQDRITG
jgi:hypothetical protein